MTVDGIPIKYELLPERLRGGIQRWIERGIRPGGFLVAVLDNDLRLALNLADDKHVSVLRDICHWLCNHAPAACFGSPEITARWYEVRRRESA